MKKRDLEKRIRELEKRVGDMEGSPWRFVPYQPLRWPSYPEPCCPYHDKCTYCPHRQNYYRITWGDTSTQTDTWTDDGTTYITYNA
jgi:hypothetical protein